MLQDCTTPGKKSHLLGFLGHIGGVLEAFRIFGRNLGSNLGGPGSKLGGLGTQVRPKLGQVGAMLGPS